MIVCNYNSTLSFQSVIDKGSVFSFEFSLEEFDNDILPSFKQEEDSDDD